MDFRSKSIIVAAILISGAPTWCESAGARAAGPFARFVGDWRGAGRVETRDGRQEPITCRGAYQVSEGGAHLTQALVCASDSYKFDIRSDVVAEGASVSGTWQETTRNVSGNLSGQIGNGAFAGRVDGAGFTASISLRSNGTRQAVQISPSAGDVARVTIEMRQVK